ncbi:hypothetical protein [Larkinella terrae]|uniref:Uncharacterized protein n=1 Tax=Larkinella terrae TaxID=2025311 RepID=A0A7K0EUJ0_9BACT|nr:hypothetical protein [Larkinella terrae]MRS65477.1 hypothetical protein [Larkinella terrae]
MALHIINISVDVPEHYSHRLAHGAQKEDLSVNRIESIGELVLENWLGIIDAVPEQDDAKEESDVANIEHDYFFAPLFAFELKPVVWHLTSRPVRLLFIRVFSHVQEITSPPPQH